MMQNVNNWWIKVICELFVPLLQLVYKFKNFTKMKSFLKHNIRFNSSEQLILLASKWNQVRGVH